MYCWNSASLKWRDFIKRHTQHNGCRKNSWSRDLQVNGSSWKNDKNESDLHAKNLLASTEVYGMMEVSLSFQTYINRKLGKQKENPLIGKLREELSIFTCPMIRQVRQRNSSTIIETRSLNC